MERWAQWGIVSFAASRGLTHEACLHLIGMSSFFFLGTFIRSLAKDTWHSVRRQCRLAHTKLGSQQDSNSHLDKHPKLRRSVWTKVVCCSSWAHSMVAGVQLPSPLTRPRHASCRDTTKRFCTKGERVDASRGDGPFLTFCALCTRFCYSCWIRKSKKRRSYSCGSCWRLWV